MADLAFTDGELAAYYDALNPWGPADDFYLPLVLAAPTVLDIGCGTGRLLRRARTRGHDGTLCGLDPAPGMLAVARRDPGVRWVLGELASVSWHAEFELAVMTGHAFQVLLTDAEILASLRAVHRALVPGGVFAFETRNPLARPWLRWNPDAAVEVRGPDGTLVRVEHRVETPVRGELVHFTETFTSAEWDRPRVSRSSLRFVSAPALSDLLAEAGFAVERRFGDWSRNPLTVASPEIVTVARRS
ncbi:class I SAM-dependent methyltransferase [Prauserella cavernicola]|uniref:Class I SAM-dependent methyltransferase n=1 Tax=Prauserella cavernicola TaxID=2800127 RepID=A0A934QMD9_9PSEU|nr:class I SAM-dependent methyltransferase [Prauserella cavernicola]MBK1783126.1 class I SAM-dependent methyltransferase [Prauserella cavernicola]